MKRRNFLGLSALSFGALVIGITDTTNPYRLGIEPKASVEPRLLVLKKLPIKYHVMNGDVFHLSHEGKEVLNMPITKMGTITFCAAILQKDGSVEWIVGDDDLYHKFKKFA